MTKFVDRGSHDDGTVDKFGWAKVDTTTVNELTPLAVKMHHRPGKPVWDEFRHAVDRLTVKHEELLGVPALQELVKAPVISIRNSGELLAGCSTREEHYDLLEQDFYLPFPYTVVEDEVSAVGLFFSDPHDCGLSKDNMMNWMDVRWIPYTATTKWPRNSMLVTFGKFGGFGETIIDPKTLEEGRSIPMGAFACMILDRRKHHHHDVFGLGNEPEYLNRSMMANDVLTSINELFLSVQPGRWYVERLDEMARVIPRKKGKKPWKPTTRYLVITDKERRRIFRDSNPANKGIRRGHPVRQHWRTYRAERYKFMRGRRQLIPACWKGPTEAEHDGVRYRVILDA